MLQLRPNCECCDKDLPADSAEAHAKTSGEALRVFADLFRGQSMDRLELGADAAECRDRRHAGHAALKRAAHAEGEALRALFGKDAGPARADIERLANELSDALHQALDCGDARSK